MKLVPVFCCIGDGSLLDLILINYSSSCERHMSICSYMDCDGFCFGVIAIIRCMPMGLQTFLVLCEVRDKA